MFSKILLPLQLLACSCLVAGRAVFPPNSNTTTVPSRRLRADPLSCRISAPNGPWLGLGFDTLYPANCAPSTGTMTGFIIFVDFPDQPAASNDSPQSLYNFLIPQAAQWFKTASYGKLDFQILGDTSRFFRMPNDAESYNIYRGTPYWNLEDYLQDALDVYIQATNKVPNADVFYVVPARSATKITGSAALMPDNFYTRNSQWVSKKAVQIGQDAFADFGYKIINHETGHSLCLPDLYMEEIDTQELTGGFDMMAWINGQSPDYIAWAKWKLNWLTNSQIACIATKGTSTHNIYPLERNEPNAVKAAVVRLSDELVLVAEVRTPGGVNPNSCVYGVLLYTVDLSKGSAAGPVNVIDTRPSTVGCYNVAKNDAILDNGMSYQVQQPGVNVRVLVTAQTGNYFTVKFDNL